LAWKKVNGGKTRSEEISPAIPFIAQRRILCAKVGMVARQAGGIGTATKNLTCLSFLFEYLLRPGKAYTDYPVRINRSRGGHREVPITRILKKYNSVFSALFGVSVYKKEKSG
jgi:hypothetical protein